MLVNYLVLVDMFTLYGSLSVACDFLLWSFSFPSLFFSFFLFDYRRF